MLGERCIWKRARGCGAPGAAISTWRPPNSGWVLRGFGSRRWGFAGSCGVLATSTASSNSPGTHCWWPGEYVQVSEQRGSTLPLSWYPGQDRSRSAIRNERGRAGTQAIVDGGGHLRARRLALACCAPACSQVLTVGSHYLRCTSLAACRCRLHATC